MVQAIAKSPDVKALLVVMLAFGAVNTAISLFYYLRVIKTMTIDPLPEDRSPAVFPMLSARGIYLALVTIPVLGLGLFFNELLVLTRSVAATLLG
ncbi:MAG: hypothetical protein QM811_07360 [Pirellulales bacterium]